MDDLCKLNAMLMEAHEEGARMMVERTARPRGTDKARVIRVIVSESLLGRGTADDPVSIITQYWSLDGKLLADSRLTDVRKEYKNALD